ncbi:MAG: 4-hydroxy-tetrahydrodipicolinate reductase [Candidatus Omnitrophica bacterium]|nr:4-hydroxy-tetrahydrodipicolinate reductase [Candidatus Omnitrophota bacterium]
MSKIPVIVNGCLGKMGREAVKAVNEAEDLDLVASLDFEDDLRGRLAENSGSVVVDFTHPSSAFKNCQTILEAGCHGVIGTTGLTEDQFKTLEKDCADKGHGFFIAPNFAITAVLMMRFAAEAAKHMERAEIIELHHPAKADSPSGTAVKTAEMMAASREEAGLPDFEGPDSEKELIEGARGGAYRGIRLHSVRMPGQLANQEVLLGAPGQTLSIRQDTIDRSCFMPGVVLACRRVRELDGLVVGLDRLLFG